MPNTAGSTADQPQDTTEPLSQAGGTSVKAYLREVKTLYGSMRRNGKKKVRKQQCERQHVRRREEVLWASEQVFFCISWERPCWGTYPHSSQRRDLHWHRLAFPDWTVLEQSLRERDCSLSEGPVQEQENVHGSSTGGKENRDELVHIDHSPPFPSSPCLT